MESLIFSLNATMPIFLLILVGYLLKRLDFVSDEFCKISDRLVFYVGLPAMLIHDMAEINIRENFDLTYVLFCAIVTSVVFFTIWALARQFLKDKSIIGEFVQASYRSSAGILGCAIIRSMYGNTGMAPLMILGSVPLFNIFAVLVLSIESPMRSESNLKHRLTIASKDILKNPIILGIIAGLLISWLGVTTFPPIIDKSLSNFSALVTPLALLSIGANFQGDKTISKLPQATLATFIKLILLPMLFLPLAVYFGFTDSKLVALIIMLGSTTTPTCYIMAKNLGHEGDFSISVIILTTILSAFTLTFWIFLIRYFHLIS